MFRNRLYALLMTTKFHAFAARSPKAPLEAFAYEPAPMGDHDVEIAITHCGICHSDVHLVDNDWGISSYPLVPGHEVVGKVAACGKHVTNLAVDDIVGVGWTRNTCRHCRECMHGNESLCLSSQATCLGNFGGFADRMRIPSDWAFKVPASLDPAAVAPLLCGGAAVYGGFRAADLHPSMRVGIIGLGGLGHIGVKFARAMGCEVTVFSHSPSKKSDALAMGAHYFVAPGCDNPQPNYFDIIASTVSVNLNWGEYVGMLRPTGKLLMLAAAGKPIEVAAMPLIIGRRTIMGSCTGGRGLINEMLEFAARHQLGAQVERFKFAEANNALDFVRQGNPRYRAVLEA